MEQGIDDINHNEELNQKRANQLERSGAYRVENQYISLRGALSHDSLIMCTKSIVYNGEGGGRRGTMSSHEVRTGSTCSICTYGAS